MSLPPNQKDNARIKNGGDALITPLIHNAHRLTQIPQEPIRLHGGEESGVPCFAGACAQEGVDRGYGGLGEVFEADACAIDEEFGVGPLAPGCDG
jgi:hypothetical protein